MTGRPLRVAIVGSGPAGMYTAGHLLGQTGGTHFDGRMIDLTSRQAEVDVFDRLPTPWGLVRGGVAPDHPEKKLVAHLFTSIATRPEFRFFGGVEVGRDVTVAELGTWYDAVIVATGAPGDRALGVPGEGLSGSLTASQFVGWYNGHPDFTNVSPDLGCERAVVVGNGNVALDIARMLTVGADALAGTDIADHALTALRRSAIREVVVLGRRGYLQSAFTNAELEELGSLRDVAVVVTGQDLGAEPGPLRVAARRKRSTLSGFGGGTGADKRIVLQFLTSPVELCGAERVQSVRVVRNRLERAGDGTDRAVPTGVEATISAGLVVRAVGYRGTPMDGLPFDDRKGVVAHEDGRVTGHPGCYVTGWIKRGPSGIIGSNKKCARDTVRALIEDADRGRLPAAGTLDREAVERAVRSRVYSVVTFAGWESIDRQERRAGEADGRPRVKLTTAPELLAAARTERSPGYRRYDAIIVGSGLGGLTTAASLAAAGKSVLILEQHDILGGCSQVFRRKGKWEFDCGVHYVGGCVPGSDGLISTVLRGLGVEDRIAWSRLDDNGMDTVTFPDHTFRVPTDWDGFTDNLAATFPADAEGLRRCLAELRRIGEGADRINDTPHSVRVLLPLAKRPVELAAIARGLEQPIGKLFDRCGLGSHARAALLSLIHLHNTAPARTPALLVAVLLQHYFKAGAFFPTQGGQVLAANFAEVIRSHGGEIRTKARVHSIDVEAGRVTGVTLVDGQQLLADVVVSNADAHRTFLDLIGPQHLRRRTVERIQRFRRGHSIFSTYVGADIDISRTRPATNYVLHGRYDIQTSFDVMDRGGWDPEGWLAISSPTLKTGGVRHWGEPGHSSIEAFMSVPGDYEFWGGGDPMRGTAYAGSARYAERKAEVEGVIIERMLNALPELRGHIVWQESATPLSHERFTLSRMPYGPENAKDQIGPGRRLSVRTEIDGLFLAGASTAYMYGVAFTMRGGVGTASHILGRDLLREFHAGRVLTDRASLPEHGPDWDPFDVSREYAVKGTRQEQLAQAAARSPANVPG